MLEKLKELFIKKDKVERNDWVIVYDDKGKETVGRIVQYTPESVIIQKQFQFDAQKVTVEKIVNH